MFREADAMVWFCIAEVAEVSRRRYQVRKAGLPPLFLLILLHTAVFSTTAQKKPADLVVINAKVRTMANRNSTAEAIAVSGDRITAVGKNSDIRKQIGSTTRVINARGRLVLPGFNDAHVHFMSIGNTFSTLDLRGITTPTQLENQIARYVRFLPKGRWILGGGWRNDIATSRSTIDKLAPDNPVFVYVTGGRSAFANVAAFRAARLATDLSDETGIVRDAQLRRMSAAVPTDHMRNWKEIAETATNFAASLGVTSVQDMHSDDSRAVYRDLELIGKLKSRVYDCVPLADWKKLQDSNYPRDNTAMVRGGCLKGFSDGDTAAADRLESDIRAADKAGLQVMIHAIGNSANSIVLDAFERAIKSNGRRDRRFRAEHAHNPRLTDLPRFSTSKIIPSMQPHLFEGSSGGYYASLLRSGTTIALGSDAAITDLDPLLGIHAAVNAASESITVYEAIRAYTVGSAFAEFQENEKGTIEVGKLADFVILSEDIFSLDPNRLRQAKVVMTVVGGRVMYQNGLD